MLEQISNLVRQYGQDTIVNNPDIPNEQNNAVLAEATNTITSGMQNMLAGGGLQDLVSMFTGNDKNAAGNEGRTGIGGILKNPMVMMMVGHLISKLIGKYKMNASQASQISNNIIPGVLGDLVQRTTSNDPSNDAFDLNDLIGSFTGGQVAGGNGFDFQDLLGKLTGKANNTGGIDLQDIIGRVTETTRQNKEKEENEGSGISDIIKGLFN
jgi:hypothetical protein